MTATDVRPALAPPPVGPAWRPEEHRRISTPALLAVLVGAFLAMADFFIVNVALGDIGPGWTPRRPPSSWWSPATA